MARATDAEILDRCIKANRILITLDHHFGDWSILPLSSHPGVIRVRVNPTTTGKILELLIPFLDRINLAEIRNHLVIVASTGVRKIRTG